jgi:hypothetical protein
MSSRIYIKQTQIVGFTIRALFSFAPPQMVAQNMYHLLSQVIHRPPYAKSPYSIDRTQYNPDQAELLEAPAPQYE